MELDLQFLTAQVRKLRVRSFIMLPVALVICGDFDKLCDPDVVKRNREVWT